MDTLTTVAVVGFLGYLSFLAHIAVHNCVHGVLFPSSRRLNTIAGHVLCATQLTHYEGWRTAHLLHHRYTNTERDPHHVDRPLVPYLLTHYFRIAKGIEWVPRQLFTVILAPIAAAAAIVVWQSATGHGLRGLAWIGLYWLLPTAIGHLLVAHFNYIGHAGLPAERGRNTRSFYGGAWRLVNLLTFNFYVHAEHHLAPSEAIPTPRFQRAGADGPHPRSAPAAGRAATRRT